MVGSLLQNQTQFQVYNSLDSFMNLSAAERIMSLSDLISAYLLSYRLCALRRPQKRNMYISDNIFPAHREENNLEHATCNQAVWQCLVVFCMVLSKCGTTTVERKIRRPIQSLSQNHAQQKTETSVEVDVTCFPSVLPLSGETTPPLHTFCR